MTNISRIKLSQLSSLPIVATLHGDGVTGEGVRGTGSGLVPALVSRSVVCDGYSVEPPCPRELASTVVQWADQELLIF